MNASPSVTRVLLATAGIVIVIAGLKAAKALMLPFLFAIVLAILAAPAVLGLTKLRIPRGLSVLVVVAGVLGVMVGLANLTVRAAQQLGANLDTYMNQLSLRYQESLEQPLIALLARMETLGLDLWSVDGEVDAGSAVGLVGTGLQYIVSGTLGSVLDLLSNLLVITITLAFILFEAPEFPKKVQHAFADGAGRLTHWGGLVTKVQRYLLLKTVISVITGVLLGVWTGLLGLDFAILWGILAFALNFIPTIGSIIAAVPPMILALVLFGPGHMLAIGAGFLAVNVGLGNLLEPRIMGDQFGLSALVVFLSLVFWGWLWGPAGMLLSVPLTVTIHSVLAHSESTRWLAVLMGGSRAIPVPNPKPVVVGPLPEDPNTAEILA